MTQSFYAGTTTNTKVLISFKQGAFLPKLPVQPVLIKYNNKLVYNIMLWQKFIFHTKILLPRFNTYCDLRYIYLTELGVCSANQIWVNFHVFNLCQYSLWVMAIRDANVNVLSLTSLSFSFSWASSNHNAGRNKQWAVACEYVKGSISSSLIDWVHWVHSPCWAWSV